MKIKLNIRNRWTGDAIFEFEAENNSIKKTIEAAIQSKANLSWANLSWADLSKANLSGADLSGANLSWADLSVIKSDLFYVLLHSIPEIPYLKQAVINGKIDGSHYEGECSCLSGSTYRAAVLNNGPQEQKRKDSILSCRNANRPSERFFLAIRPGDTPANNKVSKIVLGWIDEFLTLINKNG